MRRILGLFLAATLLLGLAACNNGKPIDPSDVSWWGEYECKDAPGAADYTLYIVNYNDKGLGWSFHFVLSGDTGETLEGVAAVNPENPLFAEYMQLSFEFNLEDETIYCSGGDYGAYEGTYVRR